MNRKGHWTSHSLIWDTTLALIWEDCRKPMKNLMQNGQSPGQDFNLGTDEYRKGGVTIRPWYMVIRYCILLSYQYKNSENIYHMWKFSLDVVHYPGKGILCLRFPLPPSSEHQMLSEGHVQKILSEY